MKILGKRRLALSAVVAMATVGASMGAAIPAQGTAAAALAYCPSHPVTYYGARGACAQLVQQLLIKHGFSVGSWGADGVFGAATRSAVERFQSSRHLEPTGVVDVLTWKALLSFGATGSACVDQTYNRLTTAQRIGQLIMMGMSTGNQSYVRSIIYYDHVGNVVYLGGWSGDGTIGRTSNALQDLAANTTAAGYVPMLIAADQEGGYVQQLTGTGFIRIPTALTQGTWSSTAQTGEATTIGRELRDVGVNTNLAPVADTVPSWFGTGNGPIGRYYREYGYTPSVVSRAVTNVVHGLNNSGAIATLKHFPGIGRITNNTDTSSVGITDNTMTATDAYLGPFASGVGAGAGMVMIGLAWYPKIDGANQAVFSHRIVTDILRGNLGFRGVVVSDSLSAVAVQNVPVGQRAVRFIAAGGDIALTGSPGDAPVMESAILAEVHRNPAFANQVNASIHRVLALKEAHGLLFCA